MEHKSVFSQCILCVLAIAKVIFEVL